MLIAARATDGDPAGDPETGGPEIGELELGEPGAGEPDSRSRSDGSGP